MYLLRVELLDVPGALGRVASAIGAAGGDIDAVEVVERTDDGRVIDDVFVVLTPGLMPDGIVSACTALEGVSVRWISRYNAGSNLTRDLEAVESMTGEPQQARNTLVDLIPIVFVMDWAMRVERVGADGGRIVHRSPAAPSEIPQGFVWATDLAPGARVQMPERFSDLLYAGCALGSDEVIVVARKGGPELLDSEIARLCHLAALASSISAAAVSLPTP